MIQTRVEGVSLDYVQQAVQTRRNFGQKQVMTTESDHKSEEAKQNTVTTKEDDEEEGERRNYKTRRKNLDSLKEYEKHL